MTATGRVITAAYAERALPAAAGAPLAGLDVPGGRVAETVRDPLVVQALDVRTGSTRVTFVSADLLVIPAPLHREVARRSGAPLAELLLAATHTHSSLGGYWDLGPLGEALMGRYRPDLHELIAATITEAVLAARGEAGSVVSVSAGRGAAVGASRNRRDHGGPVDSELTVVRFTRAGGPPIDLVSFGAHPIVVAQHEPRALSADFPGALRDRVRRRGAWPIFVQGSVGGLDPLPALPDEGATGHLERMLDRLEAAYAIAVDTLEPVAVSDIATDRIEIPFTGVRCRILPPATLLSPIVDRLLPRRGVMLRMGRQALAGETVVPLHLVRLGEVAVLGTPCDLGVNAGLALKRALRAAGARFPIVGSHAGGYFGYVHLRADYDHVPDAAERALTLHENAMSLCGWDLGQSFVRVDWMGGTRRAPHTPGVARDAPA